MGDDQLVNDPVSRVDWIGSPFRSVTRFRDIPSDLQTMFEWAHRREIEGDTLWYDPEPMRAELGPMGGVEEVRLFLGLDGPRRDYLQIGRKLRRNPRWVKDGIESLPNHLEQSGLFAPLDLSDLRVSGFVYGANSDAVIRLLVRARGLRTSEVLHIAEATPSPESIESATAVAAEADLRALDKLRIAVGSTIAPWAPGQVCATVWIAAVEALLGKDATAEIKKLTGQHWSSVVKGVSTETRWIPPAAWRVPQDHPVPFPEPAFDLGPNRAALARFYERSRFLTETEASVLDTSWSDRDRAEQPPFAPPADWGARRSSYDPSVGNRAPALKWARRLGSMGYPRGAREDIKDIASQIVFEDLLSTEAAAAGQARWTHMLAAAPLIDRLHETDPFRDSPQTPWRW